jgi:hypothetical protein
LSIYQKALGTLPEDGNVMPKHVEAAIHNQSIKWVIPALVEFYAYKTYQISLHSWNLLSCSNFLFILQFYPSPGISNSFKLLRVRVAVFHNATHFIITYLLTPRIRVLLEKLTGSQLVKNFPPFYVPEMFITAFTSVGHLSLTWASSIQFITPHPTSWTSNLLSSHLRLGLPSCLFPSGFPTKILYKYRLPPTYYMTLYLIILDLITRTILGEQYRSISPSLCSFLHSPATCSS